MAKKKKTVAVVDLLQPRTYRIGGEREISAKDPTAGRVLSREPLFRIPSEFDDTTNLKPTKHLKNRISSGRCGVRLVNVRGRPHVAVYKGKFEPLMFPVSGPDEAERIAQEQCGGNLAGHEEPPRFNWLLLSLVVGATAAYALKPKLQAPPP